MWMFWLVAACAAAQAQDWGGSFTIIPVSAPEMVLEAVGAAAAEGTVVSIGEPAKATHQQWIIEPAGDGFYAIRPAHAKTMVMGAADGKSDNGTLIVLTADTGQPWQRWSIRHNPSNTFSLIPRHAPAQGLDDFAGGQRPGSRQDLWTYNADDEHLQWLLRPMPAATWPAAVGDLNKPLPPKGTIRDFTFETSAIFPGTRRAGTVFIPAQYDGTRPACVYVRQDGYNPREKSMMEQLIADGEMPVTIGVFIRPGDLPAPMKDTLGRRNRGLEYDGVGDAYPRFLVEELLPYVARTFDLKLSERGNDRCIAGGSSGGICAFNAAWWRPDAFSRVYANSGSFVAFRGGHEFPTLVRKTEAKPIRAYLTTGTHDMENCAGDWYLLDQEMDKALKFAGYDYQFHAIDGPHVAGWNEHWLEAMRCLWKGWPEPVKPGTSAPRVRDCIVDGQGWELVAERLGEVRSPVCTSRGEVLFVDVARSQIRAIGTDGAITVRIADAPVVNGLAIGAKDELYSVSAATGRLLRYGADGKATTVAEGVRGDYLLARPDGSLYVTGGGQVSLVRDGQVSVVDTGLKQATGLACRPDQWLLAVADGASKWVYSYQVADDGKLTNRERYYCLNVNDWDDEAGATSVVFAREGQPLIATRAGVQICADDGPTQVILPLPGLARAEAVCLGGAGLNQLYAFGAGRLWRRQTRLHATGAWSPWVAVHGSPL
ncbi:MAG: RICIN domain-containing protein [Armatimonadetes bacterium]|nr:RICIN domain-containing protein [Armatimonadota bacterium]